MIKYILKRILLLLPVMLGVILVVFTLMYVTPGDPVDSISGDQSTPEEREQLRVQLGLDGGYFKRFYNYMSRLLKGDMGIDYVTKQNVSERIMATFPVSVQLAGASMLIAVVLGMSLGVVSAVKQYSIFDNVSMFLAMLGNAMPTFWQALLLMLFFALRLKWLPATGFDSWKHMILPAATLGTGSMAAIARMTRSSMLEVIRQDYITTARAKGQTEIVITTRHALKNALIPVITTIGMQFGGLLGGAVLTESIFGIPGVGKMMVDAIKLRNHSIVQGGVLTIAIAFSVVNLPVDILYAYVDPRIRSQYS